MRECKVLGVLPSKEVLIHEEFAADKKHFVV